MQCPGNLLAMSLEFLQDCVVGGCPFEWASGFVVDDHQLLDPGDLLLPLRGSLQLDDSETAMSDGPLVDQSKASLHLIESAGIGLCLVHVKQDCWASRCGLRRACVFSSCPRSGTRPDLGGGFLDLAQETHEQLSLPMS